MEALETRNKGKVNLPKINLKKFNACVKKSQECQQMFPSLLDEEMEEVSQLDEWSNSLPTAKRKRNQTSQSIVFLYKNNNKYQGHQLNKYKFQGHQLSVINLALAQLDSELIKIRKINYQAIYQNIEYCKGMYENAFNGLLKGLDKHHGFVEQIVNKKNMEIVHLRQKHLDLVTEMTQRRKQKNQLTIAIVKLAQKQNFSSFFNGFLGKSQPTQKKSLYWQDQKQSQNLKTSLGQNVSLQNNPLIKSSFLQDNHHLHSQIAELRDKIQAKQIELKDMKKVLIRIQQAKIKVLKFSLELGYDIRQQGLTWILKQLNKSQQIIKKTSYIQRQSSMTENKENFNHSIQQLENQTEKKTQKQAINTPKQKKNTERKQKTYVESICETSKKEYNKVPKYSQFPAFLTEQQINFIICKFKNDFKLQKISQEKDKKAQQQKIIIKEAYENVQRSKNRKLSMIKEKQLAEKLNNQRRTERVHGHKYLNQDTLRLVQQNQQIKATKYELIYQQTMRKLNRLCVEQIYGKKSKIGHKNSIIRTDKIMEEVKKMLSDVTKLKEEQEKIKTEEEKQLSDILKKLREQRYHKISSEHRNPITIIGCLVGWKKAKKILQNEMNISLAASF